MPREAGGRARRDSLAESGVFEGLAVGCRPSSHRAGERAMLPGPPFLNDRSKNLVVRLRRIAALYRVVYRLLLLDASGAPIARVSLRMVELGS